jgi:hypothetical protein
MNTTRPAPAISLIGAPTDIGAGARGASMGPEALRVAGCRRRWKAVACRCATGATSPARPTPGCRPWMATATCRRWCSGTARVRCGVWDELQQGHLPMLLGGDHSLGLGSISAVARHCVDTGKKLRVLWLDAHADFNTSALTPSGNVHGMPVACLCGFWPEALTQLAGMPGGGPGAAAAADPPDRHPQRGRGRKALRARTGAGGVRHALHRRSGHAPDHAAGAGGAGRRHAPACELRRGFSGPRHRARRGHHRARRPHLPRGAAVHGDDCRQRTAWPRSTSWNSTPRSMCATRPRCWPWTWWNRSLARAR